MSPETLQIPPALGKTNPGPPQFPIWATRGLIVAALVLVIFIGILALKWPFTKQAVIDALQESSLHSVVIDQFHKTYFPPGCVAEQIKFLNLRHKDKPPLITIQRLTIQGNYALLLTFQRRVSLVRVQGLRITVPPKAPNGVPTPVMPVTQKQSGPKVKIGTVIADGTVLAIDSGRPGKQPFRIIVDKLALDAVGTNQPITFHATISNPKPPGEIQCDGRFGPWNADDPARTSVAGSYAFRNADLGFFKTFSGILFSNGKFSGTLDHIEVAGTTDTPDFHVSDSGHTRRLTTQFHAAVDATNGDTLLENVVGQFNRTTIVSEGRVVGENGKMTSLDMFATDAHIEDLLNLFIEAKRAPMNGSVSFGAHIEIPPGDQPFLKKLKLHGDFGLQGGKFTNPRTQGSVEKLSESAQKAERGDHSQEDLETALSNLRGHVSVSDGIATLSNLSFSVPGAYARMNGTYSLIDYRIDVRGILLTRGTVANATSGVRSVFLKAISPFLKKKNGVQIVPFRITGRYRHTMVSLDLHGKEKRPRSAPREQTVTARH
ncbi:MAG: hypothetical protein JOY62_05665 [Acidobacteriaceae bacterium]|nr:hypothetical protein [Acidobacteriaceae bacterium]MBV9779445.1 hypothetical protein [Acidobacteriaceae bacterium]